MNFLVTAGPTREFLDPVRFISNRSSGKMGCAIAATAARHGHQVVLVAGPLQIPPPRETMIVPVLTTEDMLEAVMNHLQWCDALVMAAAPADWKPARCEPTKIKKSVGALSIEMESTPDILSMAARKKKDQLLVGFAAETGAAESEALRKCRDKGVDLMVANNVSEPDSGFEVDTNHVTFVPASGQQTEFPLMTKDAVAVRLVAWIENIKAGGDNDEFGVQIDGAQQG